uniref:Putative methyltransferase n=1 Tax=viral metagenome TaxID=1070528 RepID=A0A6H1ZHK3_9ZZZZ
MIEFPNKKYQIIYADPPWKYEKMNAYEDRKVNVDVYPRMEIEDICNLPVNKIADDDSLLFLWVTTPFLKKGLRVMNSWGFDYTTIAFVWIKTYNDGRPITGMGWYTRNATELVLLGKKGKRLHREDMNVHQIVFSPISNHSKKPEEIRNRIIKLCGNVPRIELFARTKREGWDAWGNEVPKEEQRILR